RRRAHLGVPLFEPAEVAIALLLDGGGDAACSAPRGRDPRGAVDGLASHRLRADPRLARRLERGPGSELGRRRGRRRRAPPVHAARAVAPGADLRTYLTAAEHRSCTRVRVLQRGHPADATSLEPRRRRRDGAGGSLPRTEPAVADRYCRCVRGLRVSGRGTPRWTALRRPAGAGHRVDLRPRPALVVAPPTRAARGV